MKKRENSARPSRSSALLDSIFIPLINSILVVHRSFIRGPTSRSLSLMRRAHASHPPLTLSHSLCLIRACKHARSFISSLSDQHRITDIRPLPSLLLSLICSLSFDTPVSFSASHFFLACFLSAPLSMPFTQLGTSLPLVPLTSLHDIFSLSSLPLSSYQSNTSAAL